MSLLKTIRRRQKAFGLKRPVQTYGFRDRPVSISFESDGKGEEESEDERECKTGAAQEGYLEYVNSLQHKAGHMPPPSNPFSPVHEPASTRAKSKLCGAEENMCKEGQLWPHLTKTAAFLLVTAGAFSVGKVAAIGITLTAAMVFKVVKFFTWRDCTCTERLVIAEAGDLCSAIGSIPSSIDRVRPDRVPALADMRNVISVSPVGNVIVDANSGNDPADLDVRVTSHTQMDLQGDGHCCSESAGVNGSEPTFLPQRKKLKRLNCIKLPHATFDEEGDYSPLSPVIPSPRTWFQSGGNSQQQYRTGSKNMNTHLKSKSKALLRRLMRKEDSGSSASSQLNETDEACHDFRLASDGSEKESSVAASQSTSKFKPAYLKARDGSSLGNFDTSRGHKQQQVVVSAMATSKEIDRTMDMYECASATDEHAQRRHAASRPGNLAWGGANATIKHASLHEACFQRGKERKLSHARIGHPWIVLGISITMIGLLMGRIAAIGGLVCYWYALSSKLRGASP